MEGRGWNLFKKNKKEVAVAVLGGTALGVGGAQAIDHLTMATTPPAAAESTMPAEYVNPTAGKTPESTPEPITFTDPELTVGDEPDDVGLEHLKD